MIADLSNRDLAQLEDSRAALANALRSVALGPVSRLLDVLPPAGVEGWRLAWTAGVGLAQGTAERWRGAVHTASECAVPGPAREELAHLGAELAVVGKYALTLVDKLAASPAA